MTVYLTMQALIFMTGDQLLAWSSGNMGMLVQELGRFT
jgi:hypothetical protein